MSPPNKLGETTERLRCHACTGWFSLGYSKTNALPISSGELSLGTPTCYHSEPYCAAFERIESLLDAVQFSERCQVAFKARLA